MQKREYTKSNDLSHLHDQILAAVPASRRVRVSAEGRNEALRDNLRVSGLGDRIIIEFADDINPAAIDAVVAAHDPNAPRPPTAAETAAQAARADLIDAIDALLQSRTLPPIGATERAALDARLRRLQETGR